MDNFQTLFDQLKKEMANQTKDIVSQIDEKLVPIMRDMEELKIENQKLKEKITNMEKENRKNNIILYGLKEHEPNTEELEKGNKEESTADLMAKIIEKIKNDLDIQLVNRDINAIHRIGKKYKNDKERPILLSLVNTWQKEDIMKNRKLLKNVYISEDFPKEVLLKRRELQSKLKEERDKGNFAAIFYDKLVVKEGPADKGKRKRNPSASPNTPAPPRKQAITKTNRVNAFDAMRVRSNSLTPKTSANGNSS